MKIWVLTFDVNAYDQEGDYIIAWWRNKPDEKQLKELKIFYNRDIQRVLKGEATNPDCTSGGREYTLSELEEGKQF